MFDKRKPLGQVAYHYPHDELALDPDFLAVERTDLYCHEGLILHELGHRAAPTLLRVRRYLCVLLLATLFLAVGGYIDLAGANIGAGTISLLLAATAAEAVAVWILSWVSEFAADDYMCDQGGIARAAAMMVDLIDPCPGMWTHPPSPFTRCPVRAEPAQRRPPVAGAGRQGGIPHCCELNKEIPMSNTPSKRGRVAVIGAGPAGMATTPLDTGPVPDQRTT